MNGHDNEISDHAAIGLVQSQMKTAGITDFLGLLRFHIGIVGQSKSVTRLMMWMFVFLLSSNQKGGQQHFDFELHGKKLLRGNVH